ncbi:glycosyltransferase family 1 protein [Leptospira wolffii]|uniref:glycosyltransferase family 4 protein n=1 Tax=Leptospira wolffii TaxID=409998 RepID=UPI0010830183|nr:glycosyltransferase family 1 protein [Leptospira wolffii]TGK61969.1 glycosyltransferase family 1 protein [Leptospira wolffii]TGK68570.1 glycosyltransferase family 1 protein [Leptospira wolffii]TGK74647.1 glycosyltransferase family 1 protein [Leptospira wolffii]TGL31777.1 glycosyltransferase family 1 protein [Leptospira wolffii]
MIRRMYKIGFDARMIAHSGIGSRIKGILGELAGPASKKGIRITLLGNEKVLKGNLSSKILKEYEYLPYDAGIYSIRELIGIPEMKSFDLLDIPHFNVPLRYLDRSIVTIHDIIPFRMRQFHSSFLKQTYLGFILARIRKKARSVITVSDFTAKDLNEVFSFPFEKMNTIYNGIDSQVFRPRTSSEVKKLEKKYSIPSGYMLSVGIGKEHKNLGFVLESFAKLWSEGKLNKTWVIAGASGKLPDYLKEKARGWEDKIKVLPHLTIDELAVLYSGAGMLVYPSLYEGFGFPPVEAEACACPVLSSDTSVLPEILGDSAFYFNPYDHASFEKELMGLHSSPKRMGSKKNLGLKNAKRFNWKKSADRIVEEYLRVLG